MLRKDPKVSEAAETSKTTNISDRRINGLRRFSTKLKFESAHSINSIEQFKDKILYSHSANVTIYDLQDKTTLQFTKFRDTVNWATFRQDGKVFATASADTTIKLWDSEKELTAISLVNLSGHSGSVRQVKFLNKTTLVSSSDDKTVKIWDVTTQTCTQTFGEPFFSDYVRSVDVSSYNPNLIVAGSYDGKAIIFDIRDSSSATTFDFKGKPVEVVRFVGENNNNLATATENIIQIWDSKQQQQQNPLHRIEKFAKNITSMTVSVDQKELLAASLDGVVHFFDVNKNFNPIGMFFISSPVTAIATWKNLETLCVGTENAGTLIVKRRVLKEEKDERKKFLTPEESTTSAATATAATEEEEHTAAEILQVKTNIRTNNANSLKILRQIRLQFEKFDHRQVLTDALKRRKLVDTLHVINELSSRNALRQSLANRTEDELFYVLDFIRKWMFNPAMTDICATLLALVLDIYVADTDKFVAMPTSQQNMVQRFVDEFSAVVAQTVSEVDTEVAQAVGTLETVIHFNAIKN